MNQEGGSSLDARLLNEAVIELNISRRTVSMYPKGHTTVQKSIERAMDRLYRLFDLRSEVCLAVAKDTLVVDDAFLDRKNAVYREFAGSLSKRGIAMVRFKRGVDGDDLYAFSLLLTKESEYLSPANCEATLRRLGLRNIDVEAVDYSAFSAREGETSRGEEEELWMSYIKGLLDGSLHSGDVSGDVSRVPPEELAEFLNQVMEENGGQGSYDQVITAYLRTTSEHSFSGEDIKRLLEVISGLKSRVKKQFLSSSIKTLSRDIPRVEGILGDVTPEKVVEFLENINRHEVFVPRSLKSLIERFSHLDVGVPTDPGDGSVADDFILSREAIDLLDEGRYEEHVPRSYQEELARLLGKRRGGQATAGEIEGREWSDEWIDRDYNSIVIELLEAEMEGEAFPGEGERFAGILSDQLGRFASTGRYGEILRTISFLEEKGHSGRLRGGELEVAMYGGTPEFLALVTDSFRVFGRQERESAAKLCRHYGERIVPELMNALCGEETQAGRRFFMSLLTGLDSGVVEEARTRLDDPRWYVKRNMIYILRECGAAKLVGEVRPLCEHEDARVRLEALRFLVWAGDADAVARLRRWLTSKKRETLEQGIAMAGNCKVRDLLPELQAVAGSRARSRKDYEARILAVRALGQIGDPGSVPVLREVLLARSRLFRKEMENLKKETLRVMQGLIAEGSSVEKRQ
jgi:hypothetical protein